MSMLEEYKESRFFKKYENTYFSDSILKDVFGVEISKHRVYLKNYQDVVKKNIEVITDFIEEYAGEAVMSDEYTKWLMLYSIYIDPDEKSKRYVNDIECTADGLISLRRIYKRYGITLKLVDEYEKYRCIPIIHFPKEQNGMNQSRATVFGDRIDHTLFDLKRMCEGADDCRLKLAYSLPGTSEWLSAFHYDFSKIAEWLGVDGIFVVDNQVLDLERDDGSCIEQYNEAYGWDWSTAYYDHICAKIDEYKEQGKYAEREESIFLKY